ncbi:uncharacterized protein LOC116160089 [Photinus pyralis]|uniref:uncharacterized protein LOC116160089 n=1 Tax=Photinus pyralis TaxID=7054 RepID=UPI0012677345|nr:uncharacterized protein LOC116160089 [Photinus pyralis]
MCLALTSHIKKRITASDCSCHDLFGNNGFVPFCEKASMGHKIGFPIRLNGAAKTLNSDAFKTQQAMMTATGAWPDHSSITYNIKALFFHAFTIGLFVTMSMQVIFNLNDFTNLSEILYIMVTVTGYVVKQCALTYKRNVFVNLIQFLKDPLFLSYPDELDHYMFETVKKSTLIANVYRFSIAFCIVLFTVYPILENKPLPFPFPYDLGNYRYFMYAFQIISVGVCAWNNCTIDTLTTSLMGIAAAQLDILYEKLIVIRKESQENDDVPYCEKSEEDILLKLRQCVEHHNAIIQLVNIQ